MKNKLNRRLRAMVAVLAAALLTLTGCISAMAEAQPEGTNVRVTIVGENGQVVMAAKEIAVTDADSDGALTIDDALYAAHEAAYNGGAAAGYSTAMTDYGKSLTKLWGVENGGSYGYYVNDASAFSMDDPVKDGDYICAFVYTDLTGFSDAYSYFDVKSANVKAGEEVRLTLSYISFDENWNPVVNPLAGAVITVDGKETDIVTGDDGSAAVSAGNGEHVISAATNGLVIVPPVCVLTAASAGLATGWYIVIAAAAVILIAAVVLVIVKSKKKK